MKQSLAYRILLPLMLGAHLMVGQSTDVTLRIAPPPPNMYRMADLWRGDILNASSATYRVYLRAYVDELAPQQQRVVVTRSRTFDLPPGRMQTRQPRPS